MLINPRFAILLAAYNGMQWISDQVQSILVQEGVLVNIFISVDPSSDETLQWCKSFAESDSRVSVLPLPISRFGGAAKNFFHLIREVNFSDFDYIALADQDDIWLQDKLLTAHQQIISGNYAAYSSNVTAFWPDGRQVLIYKSQPQRHFDFLFEAAGPGCTYVIRVPNALLFKQYIIEHWSAVNDVSLHDWLIYAWFRSNHFSWYIDTNSKILYRQHAGNQVGANQGTKAAFSRLKMLRSGWYRSEILKIWNLVGRNIHELPPNLFSSNAVPRYFVLKYFGQIRRRFRDRVFLLLFVIIGIY
ncbi:MAG: glycosyltransferase family 2 protein [Aquirhabdus sp.]